ncbi:peptidoglycan-binding protein [Streptomyces sp. HPF1205]|uniref:peptidoglycan-binding protein n=1 Tax=Streptomyces sp. HPF1205 TaxID=2873262 RepID=UPI001CECFC8B|nr:peptidoglycan-binding protein [Streptomyces sp. HPF1205]
MGISAHNGVKGEEKGPVNAVGYDVSDYQSGIPGDAQFVFIKATEGGHTEQSGYRAKLAEARRRKLVVGHYHFLHAENPVEGEIEHFCRVVGRVPAGELLALDFEPYGQHVSDAHATAVKNRWLTAVAQRYRGCRVGLYTDRDYWLRTDDSAGDFLWIADYVRAGAPRIRAAWRFHQYTSRPLDKDVYHGSLEELRAWAGHTGTPAPRPTPQPPVPKPAPKPAPAPVPKPAPGPAPWPGLRLVTREQWGARAWREPNGSIPYHGPRAGVKIHYLGTRYSFGDHGTCAAYVRKIQDSHMGHDGWSDIGYSFVVCEHGYVFEGRGLSGRNSANGDVPLNEAHYAVCALLGSEGSTHPTSDQLNGLRDAVEYCRAEGPAGAEIKGHRDGYATDCPGPVLYAWVRAGAPRPAGPQNPRTGPVPSPAPTGGGHSTIGGLRYGDGAHGPHVTAVGQALVAAGFGKHYAKGPGPDWGQADTLNYADFQRSLGYKGTDADGVPGETSLRRLFGGAIPLAAVAHADLVAAARHDPGGQGKPKSHPDPVFTVELALVAEGLLERQRADGSFGTKTITAYAALQRRYGYTGQMADGIPGNESLTRLGRAHGFTVT